MMNDENKSMIPKNKLLSNDDVQQQQQQDNSNEADNDNNKSASISSTAPSSTKTSFKTNQSQSIIEQAQRFKEEGNVLFTKRDFEASLVSYQRSLSMLVSSITKEDDEDDQRYQQQVIQLNIAVKNNIILVFHKLGRNLEALTLCNELLLLQDEKNGFLYFNYSKCKFFFVKFFWDLVFQLFRNFFKIYGFIS